MAISKDSLSGLLNSLAGANKASNFGGISKLGGTRSVSSTQTLKPGSLDGTRASPTTANTMAQGINFGRPSSRKSSTPASGTDWGQLLEHTAAGGLSSILGGGFGLGSISGLGSLISIITSLFASEKSILAPLTEFQLPASQNQTIIIGANGSPGAAAATQSLQDQSAQIAQAVKTAILHSSSLNDVIGEI